MSIMNTLNEELLQQNFGHENNPDAELVSGQRIAGVYAETENAIAVLSDLVNNRSYIYHGNIAVSLDLVDHHYTEIPTIWEKNILDKIHPEDLAEKYRMELYFFPFPEKYFTA